MLNTGAFGLTMRRRHEPSAATGRRWRRPSRDSARRARHRRRQPPEVARAPAAPTTSPRSDRPRHRRRAGQLQPDPRRSGRGAGRVAGRPTRRQSGDVGPADHRRPQLLRQGGPDRGARGRPASPNLIERVVGAEAYSYVFDGHPATSTTRSRRRVAGRQVTGVTEWHINADEPSVLDYNTEFKSPARSPASTRRDPFRSSDHDPVLVGLELGKCVVRDDRPQGDAPCTATADQQHDHGAQRLDAGRRRSHDHGLRPGRWPLRGAVVANGGASPTSVTSPSPPTTSPTSATTAPTSRTGSAASCSTVPAVP